MAIGAMYWGWISDIIGRRPAFMLTFLITAFFGFLAGIFHDIRLVSIMFGFMGLGIGGNLPIDGTLFLECIPASEQSLMTLLSLWWPIGQVMASVIAWIVLPSNSCDSMNCNPDDNWGWRYTTFILAFVTFAMSFSRQLFNLQESPKYLIARGRYEEAVEVLNYLALENGKVIHILPEDLMPDPNSRRQITERNHSTYSRLKILFSNDLILTTVLVWSIWIFVALGYAIFNGFLPGFLQNASNEKLSISDTFRNYVLISIASVPGSVVGKYLTDSRLGRKWTMAASTFGTSITLLLFTQFTTPSSQLIIGCVNGMLQNVMYGVIYAYTPEVFPTCVRATAYGIGAALGNWSSAIAPSLTFWMISNWSMEVPILCSCSLIVTAGIFMIFLPIETRGVPAL
ncbi:major facilitator superfamily domain-containing protein [Globomyces pollinis-pini]|nr:major facilitator superfamily domain-containing protein [Globomyces pollinis-pini]